MIKAIYFDIGGTIYNSDTPAEDKILMAAKATKKYLKLHNININDSDQEFGNYWKDAVHTFKKWSTSNENIDIYPYELLTKYTLKKYLKKSDLPIIKIIANNIVNTWKKAADARLRPGAKEVLKLLSKKYKIGIISNTDSTNFVYLRLFNDQIYQYFNGTIYLSCDSQCRKPAPEIFWAACNDLGIKPSEMVYVGDTLSRDVKGSQNAKLAACIRIDSSNTLKTEKNEKYIDTKYIIKSLSEIPEMLKKIK